LEKLFNKSLDLVCFTKTHFYDFRFMINFLSKLPGILFYCPKVSAVTSVKLLVGARKVWLYLWSNRT